MNIKHEQEIGTKRQNNIITAYYLIKRRLGSKKPQLKLCQHNFLEIFRIHCWNFPHIKRPLVHYFMNIHSLPWKEPAKQAFTAWHFNWIKLTKKVTFAELITNKSSLYKVHLCYICYNCWQQLELKGRSFFFYGHIWWKTVPWPKLRLRNFYLIEGGHWTGTPPHQQSPLQRWWWRGMVFQWSRHHLIFFHSSFFTLAGEETHLLLLLQKLFPVSGFILT